MKYYAHSGTDYTDPQLYEDHVVGVIKKAWEDSKILSPFLRKSVLLAACFHDLGKLDIGNQLILGSHNNDSVLPIHHSDAGVCWCLRQFFQTHNYVFVYAAYFIYSHHSGLPNRSDVFKYCWNGLRRNVDDEIDYIHQNNFRDTFFLEAFSCTTEEYVDSKIDEWFSIHLSLLPYEVKSVLNMPCEEKSQNVASYDIRMSFSILVDADHTDTARHYGVPYVNPPDLAVDERIYHLDGHIEYLKSKGKKEGIAPNVIQSRNELYNVCSESSGEGSFFTVGAPTGKGKTVSLMRKALGIARDNKRERIFFIIPYTNIISQSVKVYRDSLCFHNERVESVVNEIHSKVEYDRFIFRKYSQQWNAPINVSTSVQFFESLFSNKSSSCRKLHHFANSVVVFDEYHTSLPHHYWQICLDMLKNISRDYNITFLFGSGTQINYWDIFNMPINRVEINPPVVHDVIPDDLHEKFINFEYRRVRFRDLGELEDDLQFYKLFSQKATSHGQLKHHTLIVTNTIASAISITEYFDMHSDWKVYHLSTALTPVDQEKILSNIHNDLRGDTKIVVVATSIVECGIDFSFRMGFREKGPMESTLQFAGRINRHRENRYGTVYEWSFDPEFFRNDTEFTSNPRLQNDIECRDGLEVKEENITDVITDVLRARFIGHEMIQLVRNENVRNFRSQSELFSVIPNRKVTVIIDRSIVEKIINGDNVKPYEINRHSVTIYRHKIVTDTGNPGPYYNFVREFEHEDDVMYYWIADYDPEKYGIFAMRV